MSRLNDFLWALGDIFKWSFKKPSFDWAGTLIVWGLISIVLILSVLAFCGVLSWGWLGIPTVMFLLGCGWIWIAVNH